MRFPRHVQVPPEKNPDWWTVWHANQDQASENRFRKLTNSIVKGLAVDDDTLKRLKPLASAYLMWQKLRLENFSVQFPQMLASHGDADGVRGAAHPSRASALPAQIPTVARAPWCATSGQGAAT